LAGSGLTGLTIQLCLGIDARVNRAVVVWWKLMSSSVVFAPRVIVAAAACGTLLAFGMPSATAAPATDDRGYVDSTARCSPPATAVIFGSTDSSRVAICKTGDQYEYRGVRVRDGAKLIVPASQSGDGFVADNDGITYTVTPKSLVISLGDKEIRREPMADAHQPDAPAAPAPPPSPTTTTPLPPPLPAEVGGS
jgi:hypothetical protein